MRFAYFAFGLRISSAFELPELGDVLAPWPVADVTLQTGLVPEHGNALAGAANSSRWIDTQHFWLHIPDAGHFRVRDGREITMMPDADANGMELRAYLLGSAFGALLLQRGYLVLHGNAVRIGDACMVCVGDSGAGKSSLAGGFLKRGYDVLADDVVAVDADGRAVPGFPRIKLWQDVADHLGYETVEEQRLFVGWDKFNLPIPRFEAQVPVPVRWIYQLAGSDVDAISIAPVKGLSRFALLWDNSYRKEYLDGAGRQDQHLRQCSQLAGQVHLAKVVRPQGAIDVNGLIDRLLADIADHP